MKLSKGSVTILFLLVDTFSIVRGHAYPYAYQHNFGVLGGQRLYNGDFGSRTTSYFNRRGGYKVPRNLFGEASGRTYNPLVQLPQQPEAQNFQGLITATARPVNDPFREVKVTYLRSEATLAPPQPQLSQRQFHEQRLPQLEPHNSAISQPRTFSQNPGAVSTSGFPRSTHPFNQDNLNAPISQQQFVQNPLRSHQRLNEGFLDNSPVSSQGLPQVTPISNQGLSESAPPGDSRINERTRISDEELDQILNQDHLTKSLIHKGPSSINNSPFVHNQQILNPPYGQNNPISKLQYSPNLQISSFPQNSHVNNAQTFQVSNPLNNLGSQIANNSPMNRFSPMINNVPINQNSQITDGVPFSQNSAQSNSQLNPIPQISLNNQFSQITTNPAPFYQNSQVSNNAQYNQNSQITNTRPYAQFSQPSPNLQSNPNTYSQLSNYGQLNQSPQLSNNGQLNQSPQLSNYSQLNQNTQLSNNGQLNPNPYSQLSNNGQLNQNPPIRSNNGPFNPNEFQDKNPNMFGASEPENGFNPNHLAAYPEPPFESEFLNLPPLDQQDSLELQAYLSKLRGSSSSGEMNEEGQGLTSRIVNSSIRNAGELEISPSELIQLANNRPIPTQCVYNTITQGLNGEDCVGIR